MISQSARLTSSQRPSRSSSPVPIGRAARRPPRSPRCGGRAEQVGLPARGDVEHHGDAAGDARSTVVGRSAAVQRAAARRRPSGSGAARPSRSRASASRRRAPSGTAARASPDLRGKGARDGAGPRWQALGSPRRSSAWPAVSDEAQVAVEDEDQRLGQLAQRRHSGVVRAGETLIGNEGLLGHHASLSAATAEDLTTRAISSRRD